MKHSFYALGFPVLILYAKGKEDNKLKTKLLSYGNRMNQWFCTDNCRLNNDLFCIGEIEESRKYLAQKSLSMLVILAHIHWHSSPGVRFVCIHKSETHHESNFQLYTYLVCVVCGQAMRRFFFNFGKKITKWFIGPNGINRPPYRCNFKWRVKIVDQQQKKPFSVWNQQLSPTW